MRAARAGPAWIDFELVEVPPLQFLMVDGHGDPNTSTAYREAIEALSMRRPTRSAS